MAQSENLIVRVLKSVFFQKATTKAGQTLNNSDSIFKLIRDSLVKGKNIRGEIGQKLQVLIRMVRAYASGEYRIVPWKTIVRIVAVLIYFISPIDIIPDFLIGIGLTDDIALITWLVGAIGDDLEAFADWEKREKTIRIG
jgi:uncharacterized membrane protein YkvA (DUF1232 family)